jgi:Fic family protein
VHRYHWATELTPRLEQAAMRVQRLRQARLHPAAVQSLKHWFRIHHTYHSNAIEGNRLTLPETLAVIEDGITIAGKSMKDHLEAVNLAQALDFIESLAKTETPLGEREVRDIHAIVLRTIAPTEAGAYRRIPVRIKGSEHVPPEALHVPERMREFGSWLSCEKAEHPVVIAAIAHAWFETIHPFIDGNGRTGRLLANLLLMRHSYPVTVLRVEERARYYAALDQSHTGDLTPMVELTLDCVEQSLKEYERAIREVEALEPAIEYLAERLNTSAQDDAPKEFLTWKYGIEALLEALENVAQRISERLQSPSAAISLSIHRDTITRAVWEHAKTGGSTAIAKLFGKSPQATFSASLRVRPVDGKHPWREKQPYLFIDIADEADRALVRLIEVVPQEHLFTAVYAAGEGRERLGYQLEPFLHLGIFTRAGVVSSDSPPLHTVISVKEGVSAQQIATEIWTYAIENVLAPRR